MSTKNSSGHDHPQPKLAEQDDFAGRLPTIGADHGDLRHRPCEIGDDEFALVDTIFASVHPRLKTVFRYSPDAYEGACVSND